jgi:hypothetical protein
MKTKLLAGLSFAVLFAGGCASDYYKVTDPTTGREYYTTELQRNNSGAATLKDGRTGNTVNLQNSEIAKVSKEEYDSGRFAPPPAPPEKAEPSPFSK